RRAPSSGGGASLRRPAGFAVARRPDSPPPRELSPGARRSRRCASVVGESRDAAPNRLQIDVPAREDEPDRAPLHGALAGEKGREGDGPAGFQDELQVPEGEGDRASPLVVA